MKHLLPNEIVVPKRQKNRAKKSWFSLEGRKEIEIIKKNICTWSSKCSFGSMLHFRSTCSFSSAFMPDNFMWSTIAPCWLLSPRPLWWFFCPSAPAASPSSPLGAPCIVRLVDFVSAERFASFVPPSRPTAAHLAAASTHHRRAISAALPSC